MCVSIACSGSLAPLLLARCFSCWLPPSFSRCPFSPSPLVIVVLQKAGGGVFTEKEVRPIRGREHLCAVSQKLLTVLHETQPRSNSPLSLSPRRAYLLAVFIFRFISLPPFVPPDALSWPFPSFGCCETYAFLIREASSPCGPALVSVCSYDILYTGLA